MDAYCISLGVANDPGTCIFLRGIGAGKECGEHHNVQFHRYVVGYSRMVAVGI